MILPTKYIPADQALIGVGSTLLEYLDEPQSISHLWDTVKNLSSIGTFERFILGLDLLYILGVIYFKDGKARKV